MSQLSTNLTQVQICKHARQCRDYKMTWKIKCYQHFSCLELYAIIYSHMRHLSHEVKYSQLEKVADVSNQSDVCLMILPT